MQHEDVTAVVCKTNVLFYSFPQIPILGLMVRSQEKQEKAMKKFKLYFLKPS
jgi:hypothetical protein